MSYGDLVQDARRLTFLNLGTFTANTTVNPAARMGCPLGTYGMRILGIHVYCTAVPSDTDGTLTLDCLVNDVSEGAADTIVDGEDLETLVTAANRWYECTMEAEGTEKERTLYEGDAIYFALISDSGAIDTNPGVNVCVEWMPLPDYDDIERVNHASTY